MIEYITSVATVGLFLSLFLICGFFNELIGCLLNNPQSALFSPDSPPSGPIISDITEVHSPVEEEEVTDMTPAG